MAISLELAGILSVWLETLLYGLYCSLFFETVFVILKKNRIQTRPSKIFFWSSVIMWLTATTHLAINVYRMLNGYVWLADSIGPAQYFGDLSRWETIAHDTLNAFITWVGDFLVIYRCYIVWDNHLPIVVLPIVLLILSIIANAIALREFARLGLAPIFSPSLVHWMNTIYAVAFVQNVMTTGLIAYRIWRQDKISERLIPHSLNLMYVARIIIESASIYVINVLILIILYAINSNGQFVAQEAIVPTVGMVFTLITVRLAMRTAPQLMTTQHPGTAIKFGTFPGTNTTTDQSTFIPTLDSSKQPVPFVSPADDARYPLDPGDNALHSEFDVPLEDMLFAPKDEETKGHNKLSGMDV